MSGKRICSGCGCKMGIFSVLKVVDGKKICKYCLNNIYGKYYPVPDLYLGKKMCADLTVEEKDLYIKEEKTHIHILYYRLKSYKCGVFNEFVGIESCTGRIFTVFYCLTGDSDTFDDIMIKPETFKTVLDEMKTFPLEISGDFDGFSESEWRNYLGVTAFQPINENYMIYQYVGDKVRVAKMVLSDSKLYIEYFECSKQMFDLWYGSENSPVKLLEKTGSLTGRSYLEKKKSVSLGKVGTLINLIRDMHNREQSDCTRDNADFIYCGNLAKNVIYKKTEADCIDAVFDSVKSVLKLYSVIK